MRSKIKIKHRVRRTLTSFYYVNKNNLRHLNIVHIYSFKKDITKSIPLRQKQISLQTVQIHNFHYRTNTSFTWFICNEMLTWIVCMFEFRTVGDNGNALIIITNFNQKIGWEFYTSSQLELTSEFWHNFYIQQIIEIFQSISVHIVGSEQEK